MTSQTIKKTLADKIEHVSKKAVSSGLIPMVTKLGILMGHYLIQPKDGIFNIKDGSTVLYTTYSKSAAMIIVKMLLNNRSNSKIKEIVEADRIAFSTRNDLEFYKHYINIAERNGNYTKQDILLSRFDITNEKYQKAKRILHKSYSSLF